MAILSLLALSNLAFDTIGHSLSEKWDDDGSELTVNLVCLWSAVLMLGLGVRRYSAEWFMNTKLVYMIACCVSAGEKESKNMFECAIVLEENHTSPLK